MAEKVSKQKIAIFLRLFIVRAPGLVHALLVAGTFVIAGDGRRFCANAHPLALSFLSRPRGPRPFLAMTSTPAFSKAPSFPAPRLVITALAA